MEKEHGKKKIQKERRPVGPSSIWRESERGFGRCEYCNRRYEEIIND